LKGTDAAYASGALALAGANANATYSIGAFSIPAPALAADFAPTAIPELSTWAMMLLGFLGLGYAGLRQASAPRYA
jgi:hypothetical protein